MKEKTQKTSITLTVEVAQYTNISSWLQGPSKQSNHSSLVGSLWECACYGLGLYQSLFLTT